MTFILNILHKDMSILAADRLAIAKSQGIEALSINAESKSKSVVENYEKISFNSDKSLALGIAGHTQDHPYIQSLRYSSSIHDWFQIIRKHMDGFLRFHDRQYLSTLSTFMVNEGVTSFFDRELEMYFSHNFLFSPVHNQTRIHRGTDEIKVLCAGSGSSHFNNAKANGLIDIKSLAVAVQNLCTPEACIPWIQDAYRQVHSSDTNSGAEPVFVVSTRSDPKFRVM